MTLVVDIGNTNLVCGVYQHNRLIWHARFNTDRYRTADEYYALLTSLQQGKWLTSQIKVAAIASVVPDLTRMWQHLFRKYFQSEVHIITAYSPLGLSFEVADPGFIGADLIVNAYGAWQKYPGTNLVIDFGTATTLQLVSQDGRFLGTIITPGMRTAAREIFDKAALLSEIEISAPDRLLGTNTQDALLSGIVKGHALMVESFIKEIKSEYQHLSPIRSIATGGIAELLSPHIPSLDTIDHTLTLDGLSLAVGCVKKSISQ